MKLGHDYRWPMNYLSVPRYAMFHIATLGMTEGEVVVLRGGPLRAIGVPRQSNVRPLIAARLLVRPVIFQRFSA